MKKILLCTLLMVHCSLLIAMDFGLLLDTNVGYGGQGDEDGFDFTGALIPRFSVFTSDTSELFISASVQVDYQNEDWTIVPELLRTDFFLGFGNLGLRAGRMHYADPLGFIAEGFFDGAQLYVDTAAGILSAGGWYTGLLYKNRANITMTGQELESFNEALDFADFAKTYFAPRRMIAALGWEHPALGEFIRARAAVLGQFDLNDTALHSQYLALKMTIPLEGFVFDLGGSLSLIQEKDEAGASSFGISFAGELGAAWMIPPRLFSSRLSFLGRFSNGTGEDNSLRAFLPLTNSTQGDVLQANITGLSMLSLDYLARFHRTFSAGLAASSFIRSDLGSYAGYPASDSDGYFLGSELFGRLSWSPLSDIQLNVGAGAFLPSLGNAAPDADALWRVEINLIFSLY